jgi:regulatory protein
MNIYYYILISPINQYIKNISAFKVESPLKLCYNRVMKITEIKMAKSGAKVIIDGGKEFVFSPEIVYRYGIKKDMDLNEKIFFEYKEESDKLLAKQYLFNYLGGRQKSILQAKRKLKEKGYGSNAVNYAIEKALEYKLLDDNQFAQAYIDNYKKNKGLKMIKYQLLGLGVDEEVIDAYLTENEEIEMQTALRLGRKYVESKKEKASKDKLYRYLYGKGFDGSTIIKVINEVFSDIQE